MDVLLKKIYDVFAANTALFTDLNVAPVKTIDLYRGQPATPEQFEYFETPALFIDYSLDWKRVGKTWDASGTLDVHVVTDNPFHDTGNIFTSLDEGLKKTFYYTIARKLLDNLESDNTSKLVRSTEQPVDTGVSVYHKLSYTFNYYDPVVIDKNEQILTDDVNVSVTDKDLIKLI